MITLHKKIITFIESIQNSVKVLGYILWDLNKKLFSDILQAINDLDIDFQAKKFVLTIVFAYVFYNLFNIKALASPMLIFRIMLWIYDIELPRSLAARILYVCRKPINYKELDFTNLPETLF